jgi:hypothetical protein
MAISSYTLKSPKTTQKILNTINSFSKIAGYKINLQKSFAFLYTKEYMQTIQFTIASEKIKYLGVNLTKDVNDLYKENYKPMKKEFEEDYRRWRNLPCSRIGRINMVKMVILPKQSTHLMQFPLKSQ